MSLSKDSENWSATNEAIELDPIEICNASANNISSIESDSNEVQVLQSNNDNPKTIIIKVRNGMKSYGSQLVLNHLKMNLTQGTIYALLGASGCGKTTLLSCIVGTKLLTKGHMYFCGETMESIKSKGGLRNKVGYMPQELALYKAFTIEDALLYFGRIYGMTLNVIEQQTDFLIKLLQLPDKNTEICAMSGGQQRRTSFAVALLHSPQLLILDEPTVGVDPLLRKTIWEYLRKLVSTTNTTVIITTHYIEEANDADVIGIMRHGKILAEGSPKALLEFHNCSKLEQLFLELSIQDHESRQAQGQSNATSTNENVEDEEIVTEINDDDGQNSKDNNNPKFDYPSSYFNRLYSLLCKNLTHVRRQLVVIAFLLFLPAIQIFICCFAIGGSQWGLKIGIVNHELLNLNSMENNETSLRTTCSEDILSNRTCEDLLLSCNFASALDHSVTFDLFHFSNDEDALSSIKSGDVWGYISIPSNFTMLTLEKARAGLFADNETVLNSIIKIKLDSSDVWTAGEITSSLFKEIQELLKNMMRVCEPTSPVEIIDGPLWFTNPIYGKRKPTLDEYMSPGFILSVMYFAAVACTGMIYIVEKNQGMLERSVVAGVSTTEIITAQLLTQYIIITLQTFICFIFVFTILDVQINSQFGWIVLLVLLQGSLGMLTGVLLSVIFDDETVVMQSTTILPTIYFVLGGSALLFTWLVFPLESIPTIIRYLSQIFIPQTIPVDSLRSMLTRGWGITHPRVWPGFAITLAWMIMLWIIVIIFAKRSVSPKK